MFTTKLIVEVVLECAVGFCHNLWPRWRATSSNSCLSSHKQGNRTENQSLYPVFTSNFQPSCLNALLSLNMVSVVNHQDNYVEAPPAGCPRVIFCTPHIGHIWHARPRLHVNAQSRCAWAPVQSKGNVSTEISIACIAHRSSRR